MLTASEIITIKSKVKAEMQRRSGTGSMTSYAGSNWDFSATPTSGGKILTEHGHKVIAPLIAVKPQGNLVDAEQGAKVPTDFNKTKLNSIVDGYASEATTTTYSSCQASCSGLCTTGCYSGCSGCTGSCTGSCMGSCNGCAGCGGSCSNNCSGDCEGDCEDGCEDSCKGKCVSGCVDDCHRHCDNACNSSCGTECNKTCGGGCVSSCSGTSM